MSWFRKTAARVLLHVSGELLKLGCKLVEPLPDEELEDDGTTPPQDPMTDAAWAMVVEPPRPRARPEPEVEVLEGSARERYLNRRKSL